MQTSFLNTLFIPKQQTMLLWNPNAVLQFPSRMDEWKSMLDRKFPTKIDDRLRRSWAGKRNESGLWGKKWGADLVERKI